MSQLRTKPGATFLLTLSVLDGNGVPIDTTTCVFASQLRNALGGLVDTLAITPTGVPGQAVLIAQPADTATWPPGLLQGDIVITTAAQVTFSQTFAVYVERAVTVLA